MESDRSHTFSLTECGGACPTQAQGVTAEGRPFYFRARYGDWDLWLGPVGAHPEYLEWAGDGEWIAEGTDDTHGWMEQAEVEAVLDAHLV